MNNEWDNKGENFSSERGVTSFTYDGSGNVSTVVNVQRNKLNTGDITRTKTFSYTSGRISSISAWVVS